MKTKSISVLFILMIISFVGFAQAPNSFKFQSMLRSTDGSALDNQAVNLRISILEGNISGSVVYSELHSVTTNDFGVINITIGEGTDKSGSISSIDWSEDSYFVKIEMDETGGTNYTLSGVSQLLSVPYALYANSFSGDMSDNRITNLADPVNNHDAVNKQYVDDLIETMHILYYGITDYENNHYNVVQIGSQIWMTKNLKSTKYNDGTDIPLVTDNTEWGSLTTPGYCWYNNLFEYGDVYGGLYNIYTVQTEKICPTGWHVPSDEEWTQLTDYLGGISEAGGKLKETGTAHWNSPNTGATNESGFIALPGGGRYEGGGFGSIKVGGNWWSSTEYSATDAWSRDMTYNNSSVNRSHSNKKLGFSVRCVKD